LSYPPTRCSVVKDLSLPLAASRGQVSSHSPTPGSPPIALPRHPSSHASNLRRCLSPGTSPETKKAAFLRGRLEVPFLGGWVVSRPLSVPNRDQTQRSLSLNTASRSDRSATNSWPRYGLVDVPCLPPKLHQFSRAYERCQPSAIFSFGRSDGAFVADSPSPSMTPRLSLKVGRSRSQLTHTLSVGESM